MCDTQTHQQRETINDSVCNSHAALTVDQESSFPQVACQNPGLSQIHMKHQT